MSKNILIVGASSGIGLETAKSLLLKGFNIFSASRNQPDLDGIMHLSWDATNPDSAVFAALPEEIHGVVYCPGTINLKPFNRLSQDDFKNDFQINVIGAISVLQAVLPKLKKANGASIVLFSTVAAKIGMGFHASVSASKGAIEGLTLSLAAELSSNKIRVNCIAPSLTDTIADDLSIYVLRIDGLSTTTSFDLFSVQEQSNRRINIDEYFFIIVLLFLLFRNIRCHLKRGLRQ